MDVTVPDIGGFSDVPVIEVLVKPGDRIRKNDSLITLESEKASMEVPAANDGVVQDVRVKVGDKVSQGTTILTLAADDDRESPPAAARGAIVELTVPDIGGFNDVPVIEVAIKPGDRIRKESPLVTLESEKASMDVPSTNDGTIEEVRVTVGDRVSHGTVIATLRTPETNAESDKASAPAPAAAAESAREPKPQEAAEVSVRATPDRPQESGTIHASPAIRRFARELGVDLHGLDGSGPNGRITREDVQRFVKRALASRTSSPGAASFAGLPAWPAIDFAQFGEVERRALPRVKKISGPNLHRNWLQIPHITNYDEADVTDLETFRVRINAENARSGAGKATMLAFLMKACVAALKRFPEFNSSLDGEELIYKHYYNIGFAADTPNGLIVPVLKGADTKGLNAIAHETADLAAKAREGKLAIADMQGGTFTISSIGGIGGTQFTQIVNAPEVAILGATRAAMRPLWNGTAFEPRLMLPISVSYDHRVIDGASAARFLSYVASLLADFRRVLL